MSVLIDVREVPWRILELVKARILANRARKDQRAKKEEVRGLTRPRPQQKATGATMSTYRRPEPVGLPPDDGSLSIGWLEIPPPGSGSITTEQVRKVISGDGTAHQTITTTAFPTPTIPPSVTATFTEDWFGWSGFGEYGYVGSGYFWNDFRRASFVQVTLESEWIGSRLSNQVLLPHPGGFILVRSDRGEYTKRWHTYELTDVNITRFVRGEPGGDPVVQFQDPANRVLVVDTSFATPVVQTGFTDAFHSFNRVEAFNITERSVRSLSTPGAVSSLMAEITGTPGTFNYAPDFIYAPPLPTLDNYWRPAKPVTLDGIFYPTVIIRQLRGNTSAHAIPNWWPTVNVPVGTGPTTGLNEDRYNSVQTSSLGIAGIEASDTPLGYMLDSSLAGTPAVYRSMLGTYTPPVPSPGGRNLTDIYSDLSPLPPQFSVIRARTEAETPDYGADAVMLYFPTYNRNLSNYKAGAKFNDFADAELPSAPGTPRRYGVRLAPLAERQSVGEGGVQPLFATTFGADAYCRQSLLSLGFSPADLTP